MLLCFTFHILAIMTKIERKAGFLTLSFDILSIDSGEFNITSPYYLPLNDQADILYTNFFQTLQINLISLE